MENLNEIMNLSNQAGHRTLYTSKEIKELGIRYQEDPPRPVKCKFCGKILYFQGIVFMGKVTCWIKKSPQRCDCKEAVEHWERKDALKAEEKRAEELSKSREAIKRKIDRLITGSGVGKRFLQRTFENYSCNEESVNAFMKAKDYADNFEKNSKDGMGLYIEGTNGTGKTHLAVAIGLQLMNQGIPVICRTSVDMLADIRKAYDDEKLSEAEILSVYKNVDLLIIDDLGKEQCTRWTVSILYSILNDRYEKMRPTIITTNYNESELKAKLTIEGDSSNVDAIISRLRESTQVITMVWEDYRSKGAKK